jgi:hypothetical protein
MLGAKNEAAIVLGRLGGLARAKILTPERRKEIAAKAARARWEKHGKQVCRRKGKDSESKSTEA